MHFACVVGKSVSDSIPRCAGVAAFELSSSGSDCNSWDAPVELWEQFQI